VYSARRMRKTAFAFALFPLLLACAKQAPAPAQQGGAALTSEDEKTAYAAGVMLGRNLAALNLTPSELEAAKRGLADAASGKTPIVDLETYGPKLQALAQMRMASRSQGQKDKGKAFYESAAKDAGARDCLFVDAHNSAEIAEGGVHFGSKESLQIVEATHKAVLAAQERMAASLRIGLAEDTIGRAKDGIGAQGVQVLVAETDGQRAAYLLFDGNNMVRGLRDEILDAAKEFVDEGEVLTTDNHSVNATMEGYNPIGLRTPRADLIALSRRLVAKALADLRPVESVAASGTVHGLRVFGHENTARLTSSVNATIAILRPTAMLTFGFAVAASLVLLILVP